MRLMHHGLDFRFIARQIPDGQFINQTIVEQVIVRSSDPEISRIGIDGKWWKVSLCIQCTIKIDFHDCPVECGGNMHPDACSQGGCGHKAPIAVQLEDQLMTVIYPQTVRTHAGLFFGDQDLIGIIRKIYPGLDGHGILRIQADSIDHIHVITAAVQAQCAPAGIIQRYVKVQIRQSFVINRQGLCCQISLI